MSSTRSLAGLLLGLLCCLPATLARTDLDGCVSSETVAYGGASYIWYDPDSGEICSFLDCGGGRAPPKTTVPGCPGYKGTATYTPSFLPGFAAATTTTTTASGGQVTEDSVIIPITTEPLTPGSSGSSGASSTESTTESLSQPTTITGSLVSTKTDTKLTPPTVTTSAIGGTTAPSTSSSTAGAALATAVPRELALAAGFVLGLAAI